MMKKLLCYIALIGLIACSGSETAKVEDTKSAPKLTNKAQNQKPIVKNPVVTNKPQITKSTPQATPPRDPNKPYTAKNEGWSVSLDEAYAESKKTGKPIMANFTGSDWCGWCKRLDVSVFHQPGFEKWAKDNVVLLELDFPRRFQLPADVAAQNRSLQQSFAVRGYPSIWLFDADKDADGKYSFQALGKTGYTKTLEEFQATMGGYISKRG